MVKKTAQTTGKSEDGVVYLSSIAYGGRTTKVTAAKLVKYAKNVYGAGVTHKQRNLIFQEKYTIRVLDPQGESDEDLAATMTAMCDQKDVRLWPAIQLAWYDAFWHGMAFFNPVWGYKGNEYELQKLRHLPPESFGTQPTSRPTPYSEVLKGVVLNPADQTVEYWQTLSPTDIAAMPNAATAGTLQKKLQNIFTIKDPVCAELAGSPTALPIIPLLATLDFSWQAQVQKVNRTGAPLMFLKITNPHGDDIRYGQAFLNSWGKNSGMQLRPNFEIIVPDLKDTSSALETIEALNRMIVDYFSPASLLNRGETNPLSGSSTAEQELLYAYVRGIHSWISEAFEQLLQIYLDANAYEDYTVHIDIPSPSIDKSELWLKQADLGARHGIMTTNELRDFLELEPLDEVGLEELRADVGIRQPAPLATSPMMAQAELAIKAMNVDRLDPYGITGVKGKKLIQTVLGIENGETEARNYDPSQPRDDDGKWSEGGGGSGSSTGSGGSTGSGKGAESGGKSGDRGPNSAGKTLYTSYAGTCGGTRSHTIPTKMLGDVKLTIHDEIKPALMVGEGTEYRQSEPEKWDTSITVRAANDDRERSGRITTKQNMDVVEFEGKVEGKYRTVALPLPPNIMADVKAHSAAVRAVYDKINSAKRSREDAYYESKREENRRSGLTPSGKEWPGQ